MNVLVPCRTFCSADDGVDEVKEPLVQVLNELRSWESQLTPALCFACGQGDSVLSGKVRREATVEGPAGDLFVPTLGRDIEPVYPFALSSQLPDELFACEARFCLKS